MQDHHATHSGKVRNRPSMSQGDRAWAPHADRADRPRTDVRQPAPVNAPAPLPSRLFTVAERPRILLVPLCTVPGVTGDLGWHTIRSVTAKFADIMVTTTEKTFRQALHPDLNAVVLPLLAEEAECPLRLTELVRARASRALIAVRVPPRPGLGRSIVATAAGGEYVLLLGQDEALRHGLYDALRQVHSHAHVAHPMLLDLAAVSDHAATMLNGVARRAAEPVQVEDLARWVGMHPRTLTRACRRAGWPSPGDLIAWGRLIAVSSAAAHRVARPHSVARFASPAQFQRLQHRLLGKRDQTPAGQAIHATRVPSLHAVIEEFLAQFPACRAAASAFRPVMDTTAVAPRVRATSHDE